MAKPTILIVHGAWHQPAHFAAFRVQLAAAGYASECPQQPTYGATMPPAPAIDMHADAACIRAAALSLIDAQGLDIVVLMHSYGGMVGTQAITADMGRAQRAARGLPGGVVRLVYMCAVLLPEGQALVDSAQPGAPPIVRVDDDGSCHMKDPLRRFYSGLDEAEARRWLALCMPHVARAHTTPLTNAAWRHIPAAYLLCEKDEAIPVEMQTSFVAGCGVDMPTGSLPSGHSPWLSHPAETLAEIDRLCGIADPTATSL